MKKIVLFGILAILLFNCKSDDADAIDCTTLDLAFPTLYLKLVDATGKNLIEAGSIDTTEIKLQNGLGLQFTVLNEFEAFRELDNTIELLIPDETSFQYVIQLNTTDTITLDFSAKLKESICDISYLVPTKVSYKGQNQELKEVSPLTFVVSIIP